MFKKWYLKYVETQVDKITAQNQDKSGQQLREICSKKGGTTLIPVIIAVIVLGIMLFFTFSAVWTSINQAKKKAQDDYNNTSNTNTNAYVFLIFEYGNS